MRKKLTKTGNSHALVIPPAYLDILKIDRYTELEVTIEDGKIIAFPVKFNWNDVKEENEELSIAELAGICLELVNALVSDVLELFHSYPSSQS